MGFPRTTAGRHVPDGLRFRCPGPLLPGLARPVAVVMDQGTRRAPGPGSGHRGSRSGPAVRGGGPDDAFADDVHARRPRRGGDDPQSFGFEHLPERGDREGVVVRVLDGLPRNRRRELGRSSSVLLRRRERAPVLTGVYLSEVPS